jgi:Flp pilus assembly protein TadB
MKRKIDVKTHYGGRIYRRIAAIFPRSIVNYYSKMLIYADIEEVDPRVYFGFSVAFPMLVGIFTYFALTFFVADPLVLGLGAVTGGVLAFTYLWLHLLLLADAKAKAIEKVLPDALQLVSANVRAGMTIDKALWLTARPEFGPLEKELRKMAAQTLGGKTLQDSLSEATTRVKSRVFVRAMLLLQQGIQLGGELGGLLTQIAIDVKETEALKKEINAATTTYTLFIVFASVVAAPALFAVSTFYVETTSQLWEGQIASNIEGVGSNIGLSIFKIGSGGETLITAEEVRLFATAAILITTIFGGLTLGLIKEGHAKRGVKYVLPFAVTALLIYYGGYYVISSALGGIL